MEGRKTWSLIAMIWTPRGGARELEEEEEKEEEGGSTVVSYVGSRRQQRRVQPPPPRVERPATNNASLTHPILTLPQLRMTIMLRVYQFTRSSTPPIALVLRAREQEQKQNKTLRMKVPQEKMNGKKRTQYGWRLEFEKRKEKKDVGGCYSSLFQPSPPPPPPRVRRPTQLRFTLSPPRSLSLNSR
ncbi:hypothetical protein DFH27DRAFT_609880 [Peziza echinospora]|nr:hypothetical protein DFH27DRAFT_609880 [Peziza echinospora]